MPYTLRPGDMILGFDRFTGEERVIHVIVKECHINSSCVEDNFQIHYPVSGITLNGKRLLIRDNLYV